MKSSRIAAVAALVFAILVTALSTTAWAWRSNQFYSPTGNIECRPTYDYSGRLRMACTTFNNGRVAFVYRYGLARTSYRNTGYGFSFAGGGPVLGYGQRWTGSGFRCESYLTGMQCVSAFSGRGFKVAREGITTF